MEPSAKPITPAQSAKEVAEGLRPPDTALVDELEYYFIAKKRLTSRDYRLYPNPKVKKYFDAAAVLCKTYNIAPEVYVDIAYELMGGQKSYFTPQYLQGPAVNKALKERGAAAGSAADDWEVHITNNTLDPEVLWQAQIDLVKRYMRLGYTTETILKSSSVKLFAWFRILSSEQANAEVIAKYRNIAKKELSPELKKFILSRGLDLERITG